jgi:sugar phosphate isomerase/epimerase
MHRVDERVARVIERVHINMPWKKLPDYLDLVLRHRFNLEIGLDGADLDAMSRSEVRQMVRKLRKTGCQLSLHGPFWDLSAGSSDPLIRQVTRARLQQFFDLLMLFHPVMVVCHTGYDPHHHGSEWRPFLERSLAIWEPLLERAEILEIPLLMENVWEENPQFHQELFAQLPSPYFGFCLDVGHQHTFSKTPLATWLEELGDQLQEVHLHDNAGNGDTHLPVGQGSIDFTLLFQFLKEDLKTPLLTLEPHQDLHLFESLANLTDIIERAQYFRKDCTHWPLWK